MKKKCFIVILSLICMFCISFCLVACGETSGNPNTGTHTHQYVWQDNGDGTHKQHCSVSGCDAPDINIQNHTYGSNGKCTKCNAQKPEEPHSHDWSQEWASDDTHHWHNCTAEGCDILDNAQKDGYAEHDFSSGDCVCGKAHQHIWLQTWESDDTHHWHKCQASGNGCTLTAKSEMYGYAEHDYSSGDCICGKQANFTKGLVVQQKPIR